MDAKEILENAWKQFRLSTGLNYEPMSEKAYEIFEAAMEEYAKQKESEHKKLVNDLAEWSRKYPRNKVYHVSKQTMDDELIQLEERAKVLTTPQG